MSRGTCKDLLLQEIIFFREVAGNMTWLLSNPKLQEFRINDYMY